MNADQFYEEFKAAIRFLDLHWVNKDQITVTTDGKSLIFSVPGREAHIQLPAREK